jgi:proteasome beta subunit
VGLPFFGVSNDPGPSFIGLIESAGFELPRPSAPHLSAHATTVVALRSSEGVVLVADRQATAGYIANRDVKKIAEADRHTAVAISGVAATGLELQQILQLSFEHYEKMTDDVLSLEGKANYVGSLIQRINLSGPGLVVPLLAGYDLNHDLGRVFEYDPLGGCYEKDDFTVIGSGTPFAEGALRLGYRDSMSTSDCVELGALAIYEAGDNDPSTGGPDFVRGIFPAIVKVTREGLYEYSNEECRAVFETINSRRAENKGRAGGQLR